MKKSHLLHSLLLLLSLLPSIASAHDFEAANDDGVTIWYNIISSTEVEVTFYGENYYENTEYRYKGDVNIPSEVIHDGIRYSVTSIGDDAFHACTEMTSVTIPKSVTSIGFEALAQCNGLTSLTIPESVTSIGQGAFCLCIKLTSLEIPGSITYISDYAFSSCAGLTTVTIPDSVTEIGDNAFSHCLGLTKLTIPDSVTKIGTEAFRVCVALTSLTIGKSVKTIGDNAFEDCKQLTSVTIPNSVTSIGAKAFFFCDSMTSLSIPESVTSIGEQAFAYCSNLSSVTARNPQPADISLGDNVFMDASTSSCTLYVPKGSKNLYAAADQWRDFINIEEIDTNDNQKFEAVNSDGVTIWYNIISPNEVEVTYKGNSYAEYIEYQGNVNIPSSVTHDGKTYSVTAIGKSAFQGCYEVGIDLTISVPNSVVTIYEYAFKDCQRLKSVILPNSLKSIGQGAFLNCTSLSSINIPESVITIGDEAFYDCSDLTNITLPNSITSISARTFAYSGLTSITIPNSVTSIGEAAFFSCLRLTRVRLGNSVKTIGSTAFYSSRLISINIPESVTTIGRSAFSKTWLRSIIIPKSVKSIDGLAFKDCTELRSFNVLNPQPDDISLGGAVFDGVNKAMCTLYIPKGSKDLYAAADQWKDFLFIKEIDDSVFCSKNSDGVEIFYMILDENTCKVVENNENGYSGAIDIPDSANGYDVVAIDENAFSSNTRVTSVTIPQPVKSLTGNTFKDCSSLQTVNFNAINCTNADAASKTALFDGCTSLSTINIGNHVEKIPYYAFRGCTAVETLTIPESVTEIGSNAFSNCDSLSTINFNAIDCLNRSPYNQPLFGGCPKLTEINIGERVEKIPSYMFSNCHAITSVVIPDSVKVIGSQAFMSCTELRTVHIGNSLKEIGIQAFAYCNNLSVFYGDAVSDDHRCVIIDGVLQAFAPCDITQYAIPDGVTAIKYAFTYCYKLEHIHFPESLTSIEGFAFYGCSGLEELDLGENISSIGSNAFGDCRGLASVTVAVPDPADITLGAAVFDGVNTDDCILYVPNGSEDLYAAADQWKDFANIEAIGGELSVCKSVEIGYDGRYFALTCAEPDAVIRYTTDGSMPDNSSTIYYDQPVDMYGLGTIMAMATKEGYEDSPVTEYSCTYYYNGEDYLIAGPGCFSVDAFRWCGGEECVTTLNLIGDADARDIAVIASLHNLKYLSLVETKLTADSGQQTGLPDGAFAGMESLLSVELPKDLSFVGTGLFADCPAIAAIGWNANITLPAEALDGIDNPNLLVYVNDSRYAPYRLPSGRIANTVAGGVAQNIALTDNVTDIDNLNFYASRPFVAQRISFTHSYLQETEIGVSRGWETLTLPFDVQTITHETKGEIAPFASALDLPHFWLDDLTPRGFAPTGEIKAYTPYVISMPNNDLYLDKYILAGIVTFSSAGVEVQATANSAVGDQGNEEQSLAATFGPYLLVPTTVAVAADDNIKVLNIYEEYEGRPEGSAFIPSVSDRGDVVRPVRPFTAYLTVSDRGNGTNTAARKRIVDLAELMEDTSGISELTGCSTAGNQDIYYNLSGVRVTNPTPGFYIRVTNHHTEKVYIR